MNVSKSSWIPPNGPMNGYVLMNDWRWNHDREPSRGGDEKAKSSSHMGSEPKSGREERGRKMLFCSTDADVGVCASQSERERLLREGGTRRRQLSVPSVVVPPVVFFSRYWAVVVFECSTVCFCFIRQHYRNTSFRVTLGLPCPSAPPFSSSLFPPTISSSLAHNTSLQRQLDSLGISQRSPRR